MQASKYSTFSLNQCAGYPALVEERDACGVGFLADINQAPSHYIVNQSLRALTCMEHRGACSADGVSGDGSGVTTQIPWSFLFSSCSNLCYDTSRPSANLGLAMVFLPKYDTKDIKRIFEWTVKEHNFQILAWRTVPTDQTVLGPYALYNMPNIQQCIVSSDIFTGDVLERQLYILRKKIEKNIAQINSTKHFYICSFSSRVVIYKGMVRSEVLGQFYQDLIDENYSSSFAVYHRRFSTNTVPKWSLAQPMKFIAHNGEINTLLGNLNWMKSKESTLKHHYWTDFENDILPVTDSSNSDSSNLDAVMELLVMSGKSPQEALMILIPEAYSDHPSLRNFPEIVSFYDYYAGLQEPWDGPALIVFTDGKVLGASLDRNGLRPARYAVDSSGLIVLSSESGVVELSNSAIVKRGRLGPGQMICIDLINKIILNNLMIKQAIANRYPYKKWLDQYQQVLCSQLYLDDKCISSSEMLQLHTAFGYTSEDVELVIEHMASLAKEPTFCMGDDTPLAVLSEKQHLPYNYFKQRFAQVTNPAIDPLRESLVMSLAVYLGPKGNTLSPFDMMAKFIKLKSPIINEKELACIISSGFKSVQFSTFFKYSCFSIEDKIKEICWQATIAIDKGAQIIILSDKANGLSPHNVFIPPLLMVGALHHDLIDRRVRQKVSILVETAQSWNTHHFACLIGYGASAICPYMAYKTVRQWWHQPRTQKFMSTGKLMKISLQLAQDNYRNAIEAGLLKILSKMGISLISSYHGSQIFEVLGLGSDVIQLAFRGTTSRIQGISLQELFRETLSAYQQAFAIKMPKRLINQGYVQYRPSAEYHVNNPEMSKTLHRAVRARDTKMYYKYKGLLEDRPPTNLRDLLDIISDRPSIPLDEVETTEAILKRFCTGGMSLGALSRETHETLAIAMNRIGGKSNSGEGGEDSARFYPIVSISKSGMSDQFPHLKGLKMNDTANSAVKQIASGRFGVTPHYLVNARQLEIKIAQGAKPGEGGQLPGKKVSDYIAELRNCKPGVTLISPPPHHDIYSIEDLSQLIFDLHQVSPRAHVSVKLVSEVGIGTIAAGVAKGNADVIQISGHDGGTGASPLSSIKHAGSPWELGLTEVHQALVKNKLRQRVLLRVDGGLRTGKDIVIAALMGAEEFGFGTIAMIATGCVMARICHTNNCPVGVASQRKDLRSRYPGIPSDLVNFFLFITEEIRFILAEMGYKCLQDIIGNHSLLKANSKKLRKTVGLNLDDLLSHTNEVNDCDLCYPVSSVHSNGLVLDDILLNDSDLIKAILHNSNYTASVDVFNTDRSVGSRISGKIAHMYGNSGFQGSINLVFHGTVGQSFGAFISNGMNLAVIGEANDYVGKGMNGGKVVIMPPKNCNYVAAHQVILGNTCLYGSTGGMLFALGRAGERFAVRNSCAQAVVEGVGDHACEYMTGGIVVVLGPSGRNIGAGMTGGIAYFLDEDKKLLPKINQQIIVPQRVITIEGEKQLLGLIQLHYNATNSIKAKLILDDWTNFLPMFWQLVPPSEKDTAVATRLSSSAEVLPG